MGPTEIEYEFHLWNGNEWSKEFSADEEIDVEDVTIPVKSRKRKMTSDDEKPRSRDCGFAKKLLASNVRKSLPDATTT